MVHFSKRFSRLSKERAVFLLVLMIALSFFASLASKSTSSLETEVLREVYSWPSSLKPIFFAITQLGSGWMVLVVCALAYLELQFKEALMLSLAALGTFTVVEVLKHLVGRPRPYVTDLLISRRDPWTHGGFGFPSGHTALATIVACFLATKLPAKYQPVLVIAVILVGLSRMYLGMHNVLDVLGGAVVGAMFGFWFYGAKLLAKLSAKA